MVPDLVKYAIDRHVECGQECGHFVSAVLENNLKEAVHRGDDVNLENLIDIVKYCFNNIPAGCWGSLEKVQKWRSHEGFKGRLKVSP